MKILSFIFSYNRPALLYANAAELARISEITIFDDASDFKVESYDTRVMAKHGGKDGFIHMWNMALDEAKRSDADVFIFSPDDVGKWDLLSLMVLVNGLYYEQSGNWAVNFLRDQRDTNWNSIAPVDAFVVRQVPTQIVGFCDCALIAPRATLEAINWKLPVKKREGLPSSGVGRKLTELLNDKQIPIYRPISSLCDHLGNDCSVMHSSVRPMEPLQAVRSVASIAERPSQIKEPVTINFLVNRTKVPITANIATYPAREECLKKMLMSIQGQFDRIRLCLNGYTQVPEWLTELDMSVHLSCVIPREDLADNGKFLWLEDITEPENYFMLDDDLIYPPDYVKATLPKLEKYGVVTYHGRNINPKAKSYYQGGHELFRCTHGVMGDHTVHVGGTGVMAIDTSVFHPKGLAESQLKCMADLIFAKVAADAHRPIHVIDHNGMWITLVQPHPKDTIADRYSANDEQQWQLALSVLNSLSPGSALVPKPAPMPQEPLGPVHFIFLCQSAYSSVADMDVTDDRVISRVFNNGQYPRNRYHDWWQQAFNMAKENPSAAYALLPDGMNWDAQAIERVISLMPRYAWAINPINDGRSQIWWKYEPRPADFNPTIQQVNFITEAVILSHAAMEALQWQMPKVPETWHVPGSSSGIGRFLSEKLNERGIAIYRPASTLTAPTVPA